MSNKNLGNINFNFETVDADDESNIELIELFYCHECGFHSKVISVMWIEGDETNTITQLKNIKPGKTEFVEKINQTIFKKEGKLIEENICGNCGKTGSIKTVPKTILELQGVIIYNDDNTSDINNIKDE